jgi:hypothetical protein
MVLPVPKLTKHPFQQIFLFAVTVFEPSGVKVDPLKWTCMAVLSICDHDNACQIEMLPVLVSCRQNLPWYKKHGAWMLTFLISTPHILVAHPLKC